MDDAADRKALRVGRDMALAAVDFLALPGEAASALAAHANLKAGSISPT